MTDVRMDEPSVQGDTKRRLYTSRHMRTDPMPHLDSLDRVVTRQIAYALPHPRWFVTPLSVLSESANHGVLWFVLSTIPLAGRRPRGCARAAYVSGAVLAAEVINYGVKYVADRPRPVPEAKDTLIAAPRTSSFPSSHAAMGIAACATVRRLYPRLGKPCAWLAAVLMLSRPYLRVHYAGDVAAGAVVGGAVSAVYTRLVPAPYVAGTAASGRGASQ
jgi:membrane-associated phospholipid phosphatase